MLRSRLAHGPAFDRAYELWEKAGKPEGRDQEFYHQAERELEGESKDPETPEGI
jgi:hypothetical protein